MWYNEAMDFFYERKGFVSSNSVSRF
jgi:hypothetical protein